MKTQLQINSNQSAISKRNKRTSFFELGNILTLEQKRGLLRYMKSL